MPGHARQGNGFVAIANMERTVVRRLRASTPMARVTGLDTLEPCPQIGPGPP